MMVWTKGCGLIAIGCVGAVTLWASAAGASGFQLKEQSSEGLGNAYAGSTAKAYDPSTAFFNPAGMTRLKGNQGSMTAALVMPQARFSGSASTVFGTPVTGVDGGDAADDAMLPSIYGVYTLTDDLRFGLAINTPFGMSTSYSNDWVGRYQALDSYLQSTSIMPSLAYRVTDNLSVSAGPVFQYTGVRLTTAVNNMGLAPGDGLQKLNGEDLGFGFNLAAMWEFDENSRIGVNYRSQVEHTFDGKVKYHGVSPLLAQSRGLVNSDASADLTTPDVLSVGVYHAFNPEWAVVADAAWTRWSVFDELRVDADQGADSLTEENWHDTVFVALGGIWTPNENWTFRGGVAYDMTPIPDKYRTARIPGEDRYWLSGGASYHFEDWLSVDAGYAHVFVKDSSLHETTSQGTVEGTYENSIDILSIGATLRF
ncbi:aromatic hydrocarbon degradation protein [Roseospira marina]|uniref:Aromatic hydrocarbon degradation protein n=1 Tax=Roseospira marina TaxID=140057 RepID=A0A5M6ICH0_9PROT|nr:outer membrane protein transport protein [Roseospira marina]KAA5605941.1 aromatic hydrocarbon degradation protein [Roseospira marina]MBB4313214.1 long-chain fatty acid transport protein [Roseospira marina]MBB5086045.1 long-chain fatty acid transport protein [Roseospira marina]